MKELVYAYFIPVVLDALPKCVIYMIVVTNTLAKRLNIN